MNKLKTLLTWGLLLAATHVMGYTITVDPIQIKAGQSTNLIIYLTNTETNLTAYQMKVFLPDGVTVQKKSNGKYAYTANADRTDPDLFTFSVKDAADGSVLIAVFSPDKDVITGTSGELIRLPLDVASTVTTSLQGSIQNIEFTNVNAQAYNLDDVTISFILSNAGQPSPNITFADANVKAICVANWDTSGDGELSEAEAAAVTSLGEAFKENAEITSFDEFRYFTGVTDLSDWNSFDGCSSLQSIVIPVGVTTIFGGSFANCSALKHISVDANNSVYDSRNDCNAIIETTNNKLVVGCETTQIPNTVTTIGGAAFWGRWGMSAMSIPASVTTIGGNAFAFCIALSSITIPASVTVIDGSAFINCNSLVSVTVGNPSPVAIDENTFTNRANATLYVPVGCKAAYEAAPYWQEFGSIVEMVDIVKNGDLEGTDVSCFFARDVLCDNNGSTPLYDPLPATIVEGEGMDGSRCIKIQSADNPAVAWDTQFFIRLPQTLPAGTKYHVSFDYKADHDASCSTEAHSEPGEYNWAGVGNVNYTTDWQHFDFDGTISAQQSPADNPMRTIAFCLAQEPTATTYYFDNIVVEIDDFNYEPEETVIEVTDISQMDNVTYIEPFTARVGNDVLMEIKLKNAEAVTGYRFDLVLPEGITIAVNDEGVFTEAVTLSSRNSGATVATYKNSNNTYSISVMSSTSLTGNDGLVLTVKIHIEDDMAVGTYPIVIKNSKLILSSLSQISIQEIQTSVTVMSYKIGDVNDDGETDLLDAVIVLYHSVGKPVPIFIEEAGDVNNDNEVDLLDAVLILYYSVGKIPSLEDFGNRGVNPQ